MAFLTKEQVAKLAEIIRLNATWLTWRLLGSNYITEADLQKLKQLGLLPMDMQVESIRYSFVLGKLESLLKEGQWKNLDFDTLVSAATARQTPVQELQIEAAELSAFTRFRGLEADLQRGLYDALSTATQSAIDESTLKQNIKDVIKIGVEARKNYREVANDLREQLKEQKRNWHRVASTEMHAARQRGVVDSILSGTDVYYRAEGIDSDVAIVPDHDACEDCLRLYLDPETGHPKIFKLSTVMGNAGSNYDKPWRKNAKAVIPPMHPNSIAGYAIVEGNTIAATRMLYTGQIREIKTASGRTLPVTLNHPVATLRGFIPACQVQEGDYLLSYNEGVKDNFTSRLLPSSANFFLPKDSQYGPTAIEQIFHSLESTEEPISIRRFGDEFHGDAAYGDGNIDIVYSDGKLKNSAKPTISDQIECLLFETAKFSSTAIEHERLSNTLLVDGGVGMPGSVSRHFLESAKSFCRQSKTLSVGSTSYLDATLLKFFGQFASRDARFCRNLQQRLPSLVTQDKVVEVRNRSYSGHVYDLQTVSGVIVAEGFVVSNCFCRLRYVPKGWGWDKDGKFTLVDAEQSVSSVKKSEESQQEEPMNKAHELLNQMNVSSLIPTEEQVNSLTKEQLPQALRKVKALKDMHSDNPELWDQLDHLEVKIIFRAHMLQQQGTDNVG